MPLVLSKKMLESGLKVDLDVDALDAGLPGERDRVVALLAPRALVNIGRLRSIQTL